MNDELKVIETISTLLEQGYRIDEIFNIVNYISSSKIINKIQIELNNGVSIDKAITNNYKDKLFNEFLSFFIFNNNVSNAIKQSIRLCTVKSNIVKSLKKKLVYPFFLFTFMNVFACFVVFILLPEVMKLISSFSLELTFIQKLLFGLFRIIPFLSITLFISMIILVLVIVYSLKKQKLIYIDKYLIKKPIISKIIKTYYSLKFSIYYNELLKNGYDSTNIVIILNEHLDDSDIKVLIYELVKDIKAGIAIEKAINDFEYFDDSFIGFFNLMMKNQSKNKSLDDYLTLTTDLIEKKITQIINVLVPFIYTFVAGFIVMVYVSIIIPMMNVVNVM